MTTKSRFLWPILAGALFISSPHAHAQVPAPANGASAPISVLIDGRALDFGNSPPQSVNGRLLVPLRAIFEALGAQVDFAGGTVRAQRGPTQLQLQIGSQNAVVNGQPRTLDVPAQAIFGRTFVPLRFVGEALGAGVAFNNATQTVSISSPAGGTGGTQPGTPNNGGPIYTAPGTAQSVTGTLLRLDAGAPASLSLLVDGQIRNFQVNEGALVLRQLSISPGAGAPPVRQAPRATNLVSLVPNETIRVVLDGNGRISQLTAQALVTTARVQYGAGTQIILDDQNDTTLTIGPNLQYTDAQGRPATAVNLNAGQSVALFLSPQGRTIYRVSSDPRDYTLQTTTGPTDPIPGTGLPPTNAPSVGLVQTDATAPLKAGAQLTVTARATAGQRLTMSLGPRIQNVALSETAAGQYSATYTVKTGDDVLDARVTVRLVAANGFESSAQSQNPVTIDTVAPRLIGTIPGNNAQINITQPNIAISVDDLGGSGLGEATVSIVSNGVTTPIPATVAPPSIINAVPPQALNGRVQVRATISDKAGNTLPVNFAFTVVKGGGVAGVIQSFTQGATRAVTPGESVPLVLVASPGGRGAFDVIGPRGGNIARDLPLSEDADSPGTYRGTYRVPEDTTGPIRFMGRFTGADNVLNQSEATAPVRIAAATPTKLSITTPTNGATVQSPFTISGKAAPGATVSVSVTATGTQFFVLQYNNDLGTVQVLANAQGNWQTQPLPFTKPRNVQGLSLSISATQTDAANRTSDPVEITVTP